MYQFYMSTAFTSIQFKSIYSGLGLIFSFGLAKYTLQFVTLLHRKCGEYALPKKDIPDICVHIQGTKDQRNTECAKIFITTHL